MQYRLNGCGTWFLGPEPTGVTGEWLATRWITFLFLPIFPLARYRVMVQERHKGVPSFSVKERATLSGQSILKTYACGLVLMPIALIGPLIIAIEEVQTALGIPDSLHAGVMALSIIWLGVAVWNLKSWEQRRWLAIHTNA